MFEIIFFILELIGTVAFAISGAFVGINKKMDVLGVMLLGLTTAVGGGIIRDLILGVTPPKAFSMPIYSLVALVTALVVFIPWVRKEIQKKQESFDIFLRISDSIGLGVFTVVGIAAAKAALPQGGWFLTIFVGTLTGVGGGVLRDMMSGNLPYIFTKHFYACASIIGAVVCYVLWMFVPNWVAMLIGAIVIIVLRLLAAQYRWKLPKAE